MPSEYAYQKVTIKIYTDKIIIASEKKAIAEHKRCYEKGQFICNHQHYLKLLYRKINSFDHAIPLKQATLPKNFKIFLDRLLDTYESKEAKRYYLDVLELSHDYSIQNVSNAISELLRLNMVNVPALKQILLRQYEVKQQKANLSSIDNLPEVKVESGSLQDYDEQLLRIN